MFFEPADLPLHDRPQARLFTLGPSALNDRELLATLLREGNGDVNATDFAGSVISRCGGLRTMSSARPEELASLAGVGIAEACVLVAAFELGRRVGTPDHRTVLRGIHDVARIAQAHLRGLRRERVVVLVCDGTHRVSQLVTVSEGSMDRSLLPVREILNAVLRHDGRAFAMAHNHPSGESEPSTADVRGTAELRQAAKVTGLRFLGHVVVTSDSWSEVN